MRIYLAVNLVALVTSFNRLEPEMIEEVQTDVMEFDLEDLGPPENKPMVFDLIDPRGNTYGQGDGCWPTEWRVVTSQRGIRHGKRHNGIDIDGDHTTMTFAIDDGTVISAGPAEGYGNLVVIDHGNGRVAKYAHHHKVFVRAKQRVLRCQALGIVGATGNVIPSKTGDGTHLHLEVLQDGVYEDPMKYLD